MTTIRLARPRPSAPAQPPPLPRLAPADDVDAAFEAAKRDGRITLEEAAQLGRAAGNDEAARHKLRDISAGSSSFSVDRAAKSLLLVDADYAHPAGVADQRADPWFPANGYEYTGQHVSPTSGLQLPNEMMFFNGTLTVIGGTVNPDKIRELLAGSGYVPVLTERNGQQLALAHLDINTMEDDTLGPYREAVISFVVRRERDDTLARPIPYVNGYSTMVPLAAGAFVYSVKLFLDSDRAIAAGNEVLHTAKERGAFRAVPNRETSSFDLSELDDDGTAHPFARGCLSFGPNQTAEKVKYQRAAQVAGIRLPNPGATVVFNEASRTDEEAALHRPATAWRFAMQLRGMQFGEVTDEAAAVSLGDGEWARAMRDWGFQPRAMIFAPSFVGRVLAPGELRANAQDQGE